MKKFMMFGGIFIMICFKVFPQETYDSKWGWGFGVSYPWLFSIPKNETPENRNFGFYFNGERWVSRYLAFHF